MAEVEADGACVCVSECVCGCVYLDISKEELQH